MTPGALVTTNTPLGVKMEQQKHMDAEMMSGTVSGCTMVEFGEKIQDRPWTVHYMSFVTVMVLL